MGAEGGGRKSPSKSPPRDPDHSARVSGSADGTVIVWDFETRIALQTLGEHPDLVRSVCFSPDGRLIAGGSDDRTVRTWAGGQGRQT